MASIRLCMQDLDLTQVPTQHKGMEPAGGAAAGAMGFLPRALAKRAPVAAPAPAAAAGGLVAGAPKSNADFRAMMLGKK